MEAAGADTFVEFGPGKTLTGLVKKTLKGVTALNIENLAGIEGAEIYG
jgi:[acyl-carrier-protein] S-malonyltransferase